MKVSAGSHPLPMAMGGKRSGLNIPKACVRVIPVMQTNQSQGNNIKCGTESFIYKDVHQNLIYKKEILETTKITTNRGMTHSVNGSISNLMEY